MSVDYVMQQLGANEKILYTERHHWIFFVAEMIKWILFAVAVLALVIVLRVWLFEGAGWVWWLLLIFLVPAVRIAWGFLSWRMNVYVLTNRRVIESTGVLSKRVADSSLEKLTDIVLKQSILGRMLDYGDIDRAHGRRRRGHQQPEADPPADGVQDRMVNAKEELEREIGESH